MGVEASTAAAGRLIRAALVPPIINIACGPDWMATLRQPEAPPNLNHTCNGRPFGLIARVTHLPIKLQFLE
jgi:hypothetical protein